MSSFRLDFVGIGPQRTGTTWLHQLLQHHPSICLPSNVKETMFFDRHYQKGLAWYMAHFPQLREGQRCGEICPTYFDAREVPARIHELNPKCRIIANLRNPIDQAWSLYHHHLSKGRVSGSFSNSVAQMPRILDSARYAWHIPRWLDQFGPDRMSFVWLDEIQSEPLEVVAKIHTFLEVREMDAPPTREKVYAGKSARIALLAGPAAKLYYWLRDRRLYNVIKLGKRLGIDRLLFTPGKTAAGDLTENDRDQLLETYEPDIEFLENLLDRDLTAWRRTSLSPPSSRPASRPSARRDH